jgi:hypothetical protein
MRIRPLPPEKRITPERGLELLDELARLHNLEARDAYAVGNKVRAYYLVRIANSIRARFKAGQRMLYYRQ